ncbi:MAG: LacI family DNA-binding transcriptional regulator, partial [Chloroflexi bacterium]|nr:LacI family DNA-binding transcriptional regulator [Chloroflexota bacterium]
VSVQTVSRVVNGEGGISSETLQRVQAAIEALGYQPHGIARSLRTRRTDTVALLVPT